jgi:NCAIR mutase (PurE)-related protein
VTEERLREILRQVQSGELSAERAVELFRTLPFEDLGFAKVDHHRAIRTGMPEVIFGSGKTVEQITEIARSLKERGQDVLITRLATEAADSLRAVIPDLEYHSLGRIAVWRRTPPERTGRGTILVVAAGTADLPVAEEAAVTADALGNVVERLYDVGVAGIHRLLAYLERLRTASVIIVVAGMEGALPSVVAGLVDRPVIAVPTSVGYGASFGGLAALLAMLNSCAAGVMVVNIDNGFGAAVAASRMNRA